MFVVYITLLNDSGCLIESHSWLARRMDKLLHDLTTSDHHQFQHARIPVNRRRQQQQQQKQEQEQEQKRKQIQEKEQEQEQEQQKQ